MDVEGLIKQYLEQARIMQLATSANDKPWACTVHYYSDKDLNIYWISTLEREHSKNIAKNPHVSAAILIHEDTPEEQYVIGMSLEGDVELIGEQMPEQIGQSYIQKLGRPATLLTDIATGKNPHKFYRLKPSRIVLFDSKNIAGNPRREWIVSA